MKRFKSMLTLLLALSLITIFSFGCKDQNSIVQPENISNDQQALEKVAEQDELIQSFDANYNEDQAMDFVFGKTNTQIFPVRVGQKMRLVNAEFNATIQGDSAYGTLTRTFEGMLFIIASYDSNATPFDSNLTLVQKPFTTTVTRNIIFKRVGNSNNPLENWKVVAVSLPEGGTLTDNISIKSMTVYLPNGDSLKIDSPNDYYLSRDEGIRHLIPILRDNQFVDVDVEIQSVYEDPDFVTLTYGAGIKSRMHRAKRKFEMVSETFDGQFYHRVYKGSWRINQFPGLKHAVVNAFPRLVIYDDQAPVESNSWGIPYMVR